MGARRDRGSQNGATSTPSSAPFRRAAETGIHDGLGRVQSVTLSRFRSANANSIESTT
jgi:hypothetical protein